MEHVVCDGGRLTSVVGGFLDAAARDLLEDADLATDGAAEGVPLAEGCRVEDDGARLGRVRAGRFRGR